MRFNLFLFSSACISARGTGQQTAERKERPAVASGGGPGGHERADEEAQGSCGSGTSQTAVSLSTLELLEYFCRITCVFLILVDEGLGSDQRPAGSAGGGRKGEAGDSR